jgi:hypothetical protein
MPLLAIARQRPWRLKRFFCELAVVLFGGNVLAAVIKQ